MRSRVFVAALGLAAAVTTNATAQNFRDLSFRCTPGALRACVSIQMWTSAWSGGTDVVMRVRNLQGWSPVDNSGGSVLRKLGIVLPNITAASNLLVTNLGAIQTSNPGSFWSLNVPGGIGNMIELDARVGVNGEGGIVGCNTMGLSQYFSSCNGGLVQFSFRTYDVWQAGQSEIAWLIRDGAGATECDSDVGNGNPRYLCPMVTPEPMSIVLLGSGIAGMGGFGVFRRRKQNGDIESA